MSPVADKGLQHIRLAERANGRISHKENSYQSIWGGYATKMPRGIKSGHHATTLRHNNKLGA